jgi:hypothetical protein
MTVEKQIRQPIRLDIVGETLNYILSTKDPYKKLTNVDQSVDTKEASTAQMFIAEVLRKYFKIDINFTKPSGDSYSTIETSQVRPGDIITLDTAPTAVYLVTYANIGQNFITWPRLPTKHALELKGIGVRTYKVIRPKLDSVSNETLKQIQDTAIEVIAKDPDLAKRLRGDSLTWKAPDEEYLSEGYLQIGDIGLLVDPTQIAFTTQNGYQYFPTLRTNGSPKIPTIDQVKNISISLIFPNQDSINFQLMNIIAMFKRSPFVNIRNKDICEFFSDIVIGGSAWPFQWLSVALESIQIQSLDGFPNTVQAQITILPFDSRIITPGFQALKTMNDVAIQQAVLYNTSEVTDLIRISESKLDEQSIISQRFLDVVPQIIEKSYDFRESLPFRAYYQSIIHDRTSVLDEYGEPVRFSDNGINKTYSIEKFRPTNFENKLFHYDANTNNSGIFLTYTYIDGEFHEISKQVAAAREQEQDNIIKRLTEAKIALESPKDILGEVVTTFHTIKDAFQEFNHRFNRANKIIPIILDTAGITLDREAEAANQLKPIESLFDLIFRGILQRTGIEQSFNFVKDLTDFSQGKFSKDAFDPIAALGGLVYYGTDNGLDNEGAITTAQNFIKQISDWLNTPNSKLNEDRKKRFSTFLTNIRLDLMDDIALTNPAIQNKLHVVVDPSQGESPYSVARIPIQAESIEIDNHIDVITGWSIIFSNKFVPISLQAFKYPYYQHMGSEDAVVNLTIKSTETSILKGKLSLLSERLYQTNKLLLMHAPHLSAFMDGRLTIDCPESNLFKAFGVRKVVYNTSNISSDPNNPKCWNINVSFTQTSFTIDDYHKIEHVPTNNKIKQEIAKVLARIDIVRKDDNDRGEIIVRQYKIKNATPSIENKVQTVSNDNEKQTTPNSSSLYSDIDDLDTILRIKFLLSRHGEKLANRIKEVESIQKKQALRRQNRKQILNNFAAAAITTGSEGMVPYDPVKAELKEETVTGESILKQIEDVKSVSETYENEITGVLTKSLIISRDESATIQLNNIMNEFPLFDKIIRFLLNAYDSILQRHTNGLVNLIQPQRTWFEIFAGIDNDITTSNNAAPASHTITAMAVATFASSNHIVRAIGLGVSAIALAVNAVDSALVSYSRSALNDASNELDKFFFAILDEFNSSSLYQLGSQIYRDPVIRNKLISTGMIAKSSLEALRESESKLVVNCYNDFDLPVIDEGYTLSPDFYLYNSLIDRTEVETFITEAIKRHARIGKLTALMTLQEEIDAVGRFDEIIRQVGELEDSNIISQVTSILLDESVPSISEAIPIAESKKLKLETLMVNLSRATDNLNDNLLSPEREQELLNLYDQTYPKAEEKDIKSWQKRRDEFEQSLRLAKGSVNIEKRKLNLLYAARMTTLLRIFEQYVGINQYMSQSIGGQMKVNLINDSTIGSKPNKDQPGFIAKILGVNDEYQYLTKSGSDLSVAQDLYNSIELILKNANEATTHKLNGNVGTTNKKSEDSEKWLALKNSFHKGTCNKTGNNFVSTPYVRNLQNSIYNDISLYIRLNTFLQDFSEEEGTISFDQLPELKFLEFWNFRERDALARRNQLTNDFLRSYKESQHNSIKMFPTFKIFFIEEDRGIWKSVDDYYTYNAIQSIELVSSKHSAGVTAIIRLSNVMNNLTDKLSFHREQQDILLANNGKASDVFFGSLDIKPGTAMMIKMGYAPNDKYLDTLFVGRIIEMNAGPVVEMVCQSYGAQLNHHIVAEHFGFLATRVREHGDVAASLLDMIPGLEKLGKLPLFGLTTGEFSGKNLRNVRGKAGDRFLLGNLLSNVSALSFAQDNPRDENIYLPFSMVPTTFHHPTFDWIVYDQSVWESLKELCLYNRNSIPVVRLYNNDAISFNNDVRETLVVGDKAGYYKYTDSLSLSTLSIREIDKAREDFKNIKDVLISIFDNGTFVYSFEKPRKNEDGLYVTDIFLNKSIKKIVDIWLFFQNRTNALLIISNVLDKINIVENVEADLSSFISQYVNSIDFFGQNNDLAQFINILLQFSSVSNLTREQANGKIGEATGDGSDPVVYKFQPLLKHLGNLYKDHPNILDISEESFYNIKTQIGNSDDVAGDPRYRKIQDHHLITDTKDIISNNIALNNQFANSVNVFYTGEPTIKNANLSDVRESIAKKDINIWPVKAFGNIKDEHLRTLNSYQKNIDTNWWDISSNVKSFFKGFNRIKLDKGELPVGADKLINISSIMQDGNKKNLGTNTNIPRWDLFPSFVVVGVSLLMREVEKMYQGTIEIVGNPKIKPYDIIHIQDYTNDIHGAVEVEEVIHSFTPEGGFRTIITPNLITYDRDPLQLQDVQIVNNMYDFASAQRTKDLIALVGSLAAIGVGFMGGPYVGAGVSLIAAPIAWNSSVGAMSRYHKFLYDSMATTIGRDCINFTSLIYHGVPYIAGFDGVDYTNLKTLINQKVEGIKDPISRLAAFSDPLAANITTNFNPSEASTMKLLLNHWIPGISALDGYSTNSNLKSNYYSIR